MEKQKLLVLVGLPASGKSTYAKELISSRPSWKRVNKDDLRSMVDNDIWSKDNEKSIVAVEQAIAQHYLTKGYSVVVDDTNFAHIERWREVAEKGGYEFEVKKFETGLFECVVRDAGRARSVGGTVIQRMFEQNYKRKEESDYKLPCYIFDIDGTIALVHDRSPYDHSKVYNDIPNEPIVNILSAIYQTNTKIVLLSGRDSVCREETERWLRHHNIPYNELYMRAEGDRRKDSIVKEELYRRHVEPQYNVNAVFDDRNQVVDLWRRLGLVCLQVNYGFF